MKILILILIALTAHLQYRLWNPEGSLAQVKNYELRLANLKKQIEEKQQRNDALYAEVEDLHQGQEALEERARDELGMIRPEETFFQVID